MLSYTFIDSLSQVSDLGPKGPLVYEKLQVTLTLKNDTVLKLSIKGY